MGANGGSLFAFGLSSRGEATSDEVDEERFGGAVVQKSNRSLRKLSLRFFL